MAEILFYGGGLFCFIWCLNEFRKHVERETNA